MECSGDDDHSIELPLLLLVRTSIMSWRQVAGEFVAVLYLTPVEDVQLQPGRIMVLIAPNT